MDKERCDAYAIADAPRSSWRVGSCDDPVDYELTDITQAHMAPNERPSRVLLKKQINMSMFHDMSEDPSKRIRWNQRASLSIRTNDQTSRTQTLTGFHHGRHMSKHAMIGLPKMILAPRI
ncbi:hypothetical protein F4774DRAFT_310630 [Daldinia eschscholtzii]|nr:hypothetical protein F4774DRAFT_310630 [Daldinia eschscholtzii]